MLLDALRLNRDFNQPMHWWTQRCNTLANKAECSTSLTETVMPDSVTIMRHKANTRRGVIDVSREQNCN
jgi:hypothetical protein